MADYLLKRGNVFWFQRAVPKEHRQHIGRCNWAQSLKTSCRQTAIIRARELTVATDREIENISGHASARIWVAQNKMKPRNVPINVSEPADFSTKPVVNSFHHAFARYIEEAEIKESSRSDFKVALNRFRQVFSDKPVDQIYRTDIERFRDLLRRMPSRPPNHIRALPMVQQVAWVEARAEVRTMQKATVSVA
ncbi:MAG: hypothetical protein P8P53_02910 [Tateyamaria sp.]|nr:hypothetical protein [Tateyamaria sp.]